MTSKTTSVFFSIIVPTSNRPDTLLVTLNAIKAQNYNHYEVLIINNGTRPKLVEQYNKLEAMFDEKFIFLNFHNQFAQGFGPAIARNIGINAAKGEYIAFCDDDDKWTYSEYLEEINHYIKQYQPDIVLAEQQGIRLVDNRELCERPTWFKDITKSPHYKKQTERFGQMNFDYFNTASPIPHLNISIYKKTLLQKINCFDRSLWYEEDLDLFLRAALHCKKISYYNQLVAKHYIPNKETGTNITANVDDLKKHQIRCYIAHKLLLSAPPPASKRYAKSLLTFAAKHISVHFINERAYKLAFYYAKIALAASFNFKWLGYTLYLKTISIFTRS